MNKKLVSIQNSGESLEKVLALYNTANRSEQDFYENYNVEIYYGHNLPKKNINISAHGTVKFYSEYFSSFSWCPPCNKNEIFQNRVKILDDLICSKRMSCRVANKLENNIDLFWNVISQLPFSYIYPEFIEKIKNAAEHIFGNVTFLELMLEQNYMSIYASLPEEKQYYSIYCLELDGNIGHYYMNFPLNEYREKNLYHMFKELSNKPVLSGNSAILLAQINEFTRKSDCIYGYRNHSRQIRPSRDFALNIMLNKGEILEPKNIHFSKYFEKIDMTLDSEAQANIAIANAYMDFISENITTINI